MSLSSKQLQLFSLYRRILRVHEKKLPFEMRVLGNLFVKQEFKRTVSSKPHFMNPFINEWEAYYNDLSKDRSVGIDDLLVKYRSLLNESQKEQFETLEKEAKNVFHKKNQD